MSGNGTEVASASAQQQAPATKGLSNKQAIGIGTYISRIMKAELSMDNLVFTRKALILSLAINCCLALLSLVLFSATGRVDTKYFTVDPAGRITQVVGLDEPYLTEGAVRDWASDCVRDSYTFSFMRYRSELSTAIGRCFTASGADAYKKQINESAIIEEIASTEGYLITSKDGAAILKGQKRLDGVLHYQVEVPVLVEKRKKGRRPDIRKWVVTLTLRRVNNLEKASGLGIVRWYMEPRK